MMPGPAAADALGVGQDQVAGVAGRVDVDRHQAGNAPALLELAADEMAGALGGDHADIDSLGRCDQLEVDREAVGEHQQVPGSDPVGDLRLPDVGLALVGKQDHDDVALAGGVGDAFDREAQPLRPRPRLAESGRRPTTTSTPDSLRFSAWAWPWEP